ncbi:MAG: NAD(P)H-hydrate dehydratase [Phycisphaerae bacterium]
MPGEFHFTKEIPPLPIRGEDAHKGRVGRIVVIGGQTGELAMIGAVALTINAAYRAGAGLVRAIVPNDIVNPIATLAPGATFAALVDHADTLLRHTQSYKADVLAIGPGMGRSLSRSTLLTLVDGFDGNIVLDADALTVLGDGPTPSISNPQRVVLTPHHGEMLRLLRNAESVDQEGLDRTDHPGRIETAKILHETYRTTCILKGHRTIVTNGDRLYVNETGNAGMATGGSGDVLTGLIAALIGQGMETLEAAILGTYVHGLAGDFAAEEMGRISLVAQDLLTYLPESFREYESNATDLP